MDSAEKQKLADAMIELRDLSVGYKNRLLIEHASCQLPAGCLAALIGRNGAGKSSLLRVVAGADKPLSGQVLLDGQDIGQMKPKDRARLLAFVSTQRVRIPNLRCKDIVALGRAPYTDWIGRLSSEDKRIVSQALEDVGMAEYADRTMDQMSDGECQRIMVARALAQQTPVILLDEPTSFLDIPNRRALCQLLRDFADQQGKCILFSTHELDLALALAHQIWLLDPPSLITGIPVSLQPTISRVFS